MSTRLFCKEFTVFLCSNIILLNIMDDSRIYTAKENQKAKGKYMILGFLAGFSLGVLITKIIGLRSS